ncbi:hypothetical protein LTR66_015361 [Elasticomyces elasticus]|nr:hypothetical protein LTR66_015361 [Elasticomyces elasticus]
MASVGRTYVRAIDIRSFNYSLRRFSANFTDSGRVTLLGICEALRYDIWHKALSSMGDADSDNDSITSLQEYELDEGIPQVEDPFIQKFMAGRTQLIEQEKKQRHDRLFKANMTPLAKQAAKILSSIRKRELKEIWSGTTEADLYPGMAFSHARDRAERTDVYKCLARMPKGALLHAHMDAMVDMEWLVDQTLAEKGMCIVAPQGQIDVQKRIGVNGIKVLDQIQFKFVPEAILAKNAHKSMNIWKADRTNYTAGTPIPVREAQRTFPDDTTTFKKWLVSRCRIDPDEVCRGHEGVDAIWRKFQSTFMTVEQMLFYEPVFRRGMQKMLAELVDDGISYVDFRLAFLWEWHPTGSSKSLKGLEGHTKFFEVWSEEIEKFKKTEKGKSFKGCRMIWTIIRVFDNRMIAESMKECIAIKKKYPHLICGFDCVGQEDGGRTLQDLTPLLFWFRKKCAEAGVEIPFFFHAGECLGDGDSTDQNLFDAILLGTRRIGHGYSLYKHPLLIDMVKEKKILVESCPISNEVLRLNSTILGHSMPALLSRGVPVSLNNDDPYILGHSKNGLTTDFYQSFMGFENLGLEGLGTMAENSLKWAAIEDQKNAEWLKGISEGYMGKSTKAQMLKAWRTEFEKWCQWVVMKYPLEAGVENELEDEEDEEDEDDEDDEDDDEE